MEKGSYPLKLSEDLSINLFEYSAITLKGTKKQKIVKAIIKNNREYDTIVLDRDGIMSAPAGNEYLEGERKPVIRLNELADREIESRMEKLAYAGCRNFFEYNLKNTEGDVMKPTLVFYLSRNLTRTADSSLRRLAVFAKAVGLFPFFCDPEDDKISFSLLGSSYLDITADKNGSYITEHSVTVDTPFSL